MASRLSHEMLSDVCKKILIRPSIFEKYPCPCKRQSSESCFLAKCFYCDKVVIDIAGKIEDINSEGRLGRHCRQSKWTCYEYALSKGHGCLSLCSWSSQSLEFSQYMEHNYKSHRKKALQGEGSEQDWTSSKSMLSPNSKCCSYLLFACYPSMFLVRMDFQTISTVMKNIWDAWRMTLLTSKLPSKRLFKGTESIWVSFLSTAKL